MIPRRYKGDRVLSPVRVSASVALLLLGLAEFRPGFALAQRTVPADSINRYVQSELVRRKIPGASLVILRGDRIELSRGFGWANLELRVPASDSTIYQSGSMGKQFTAAGVVMLAQQGRFHLDDRITRWLPEGAGVWDSISLRHLLTHTSGITEYTDSTFDYRKDYTEDELVKFAASRPLDFTPGQRWSYSNTGYLLLGVLMHRATGRFYGDLLQDFIFKPLGMRSTRIISQADIVPNRAAGYQLVKNEIKNQEWVSPSLNSTADGSLYFSVKDLARWAIALNHRRIPSEAGLSSAWTPVRLNDGGTYPYGFGWDLGDQRGHARIGHTGSWQGFKTALYRYPEYDLTIILLANLADAEPGSMVQAIAGIIEPELRPPHVLSQPLTGDDGGLRVSDQISAIVSGADSGRTTTPGLQRFLSPALAREWNDLLLESKPWTQLGCENVLNRQLSRLGESIERICYSRGVGHEHGALISGYYTSAGRVAYLDYYLF